LFSGVKDCKKKYQEKEKENTQKNEKEEEIEFYP
jgi:hypothetical protein